LALAESGVIDLYDLRVDPAPIVLAQPADVEAEPELVAMQEWLIDEGQSDESEPTIEAGEYVGAESNQDA